MRFEYENQYCDRHSFHLSVLSFRPLSRIYSLLSGCLFLQLSHSAVGHWFIRVLVSGVLSPINVTLRCMCCTPCCIVAAGTTDYYLQAQSTAVPRRSSRVINRCIILQLQRVNPAFSRSTFAQDTNVKKRLWHSFWQRISDCTFMNHCLVLHQSLFCLSYAVY